MLAYTESFGTLTRRIYEVLWSTRKVSTDGLTSSTTTEIYLPYVHRSLNGRNSESAAVELRCLVTDGLGQRRRGGKLPPEPAIRLAMLGYGASCVCRTTSGPTSFCSTPRSWTTSLLTVSRVRPLRYMRFSNAIERKKLLEDSGHMVYRIPNRIQR